MRDCLTPRPRSARDTTQAVLALLFVALAMAAAGCSAIMATLHPADVAPPELGQPWRAPDVASARPLAAEALPGVPPTLAPEVGRLSLAQLLDVALQTNPQTERAWQDAHAALADWDVERGRYLPRLYGMMSVIDRRNPG